MKLKQLKNVRFALVIVAAPLIMGASCGSPDALWNKPAAPIEDVTKVVEANKKAARDIGKGVTDWGSNFAEGWRKADEPDVTPKRHCKPWKIICQGSN